MLSRISLYHSTVPGYGMTRESADSWFELEQLQHISTWSHDMETISEMREPSRQLQQPHEVANMRTYEVQDMDAQLNELYISSMESYLDSYEIFFPTSYQASKLQSTHSASQVQLSDPPTGAKVNQGVPNIFTHHEQSPFQVYQTNQTSETVQSPNRETRVPTNDFEYLASHGLDAHEISILLNSQAALTSNPGSGYTSASEFIEEMTDGSSEKEELSDAPVEVDTNGQNVATNADIDRGTTFVNVEEIPEDSLIRDIARKEESSTLSGKRTPVIVVTDFDERYVLSSEMEEPSDTASEMNRIAGQLSGTDMSRVQESSGRSKSGSPVIVVTDFDDEVALSGGSPPEVRSQELVEDTASQGVPQEGRSSTSSCAELEDFSKASQDTVVRLPMQEMSCRNKDCDNTSKVVEQEISDEDSNFVDCFDNVRAVPHLPDPVRVVGQIIGHPISGSSSSPIHDAEEIKFGFDEPSHMEVVPLSALGHPVVPRYSKSNSSPIHDLEEIRLGFDEPSDLVEVDIVPGLSANVAHPYTPVLLPLASLPSTGSSASHQNRSKESPDKEDPSEMQLSIQLSQSKKASPVLARENGGSDPVLSDEYLSLKPYVDDSDGILSPPPYNAAVLKAKRKFVFDPSAVNLEQLVKLEAADKAPKIPHETGTVRNPLQPSRANVGLQNSCKMWW